MKGKLKLSRKFPFFKQQKRIAAFDPVSLLPPEIVYEVFESCLPEHFLCVGHVYEAPINLSQVSRRWRSMALSVPKLWSVLSLFLSMRRRVSNDNTMDVHVWAPNMPINAWKLWVERSAMCSLSLHIGDHPYNHSPTLTTQTYLEVVRDKQWRELHMSLPPASQGVFEHLTLNPNNSSGLEVLHTRNLLISFDPQGPHLEVVYKFPTSNPSLVRQQIATSLRQLDFTLDLPGASIWAFANEPYDLCPLIALVCGASSTLSLLSISLPPLYEVDLRLGYEVQTMPKLQVLALKGNSAAARVFLDHIVAPNLQKLSIEFSSANIAAHPFVRQDRDWIITFLQKSSPPVSDLKIYVGVFEYEDIRKILTYVPKLRYLTLTSGHAGYWNRDGFTTAADRLFLEDVCPELEEIRHYGGIDTSIRVRSATTRGDV